MLGLPARSRSIADESMRRKGPDPQDSMRGDSVPLLLRLLALRRETVARSRRCVAKVRHPGARDLRCTVDVVRQSAPAALCRLCPVPGAERRLAAAAAGAAPSYISDSTTAVDAFPDQ